MNTPSLERLLLVDDDEMTRDMLSRRLERLGYEVLLAADAARGIFLAQHQQPHLILMDIDLPGMNGREASTLLKRDTLTGAIPIIAITAHTMTELPEAMVSAGCDDYEPKPINLEHLLEKIRRLTGRTAGSDSTSRVGTPRR